MILSVYFLRRLFLTAAMVSGVFLGMILLLDMVEQLRRLSGTDAGFADALRLSLLNAPEAFYEIAPLVLMLAALWLGLGWSRNSEFVVIRAAGRSVPRLLAVPAVVLLLVSALFMVAMNPLVASSAREYQRSLNALMGGTGAVVALAGNDLWLRQADAQGQTVIHAPRAEETGTVLFDASFLVFHPERGLSVRLSAARADLRPGAWQLQDVKQWRLSDLNPEAQALSLPSLAVPTDLTPEKIRDSFAQVRTIPLFQLPGFIAALERAGFSAREHQMRLHMELALPVLLTGMMLLALALSIHHARSGGAGIRALITILSGFTLFFLRNFAQVLGETGQIPVLLAAWGLPIATVLLALGVMLNLEEN
ncbi:LPS export ABC transporter permease LptG [Roseibaca sp. Y0-43]|uniref:LPS export ABC transporter permease LptG n=1 Tax=Roseibaca sp. Y0-43 TaxID=2816854 RepID=UPI001D0CC452|nr:LPS export ABC transporter permease LptG [Roseibaca sp. Y0-43]MCC1480102.1 LPS export ABC transporter permease LptG [Roseibaca sp. Y0-43]